MSARGTGSSVLRVMSGRIRVLAYAGRVAIAVRSEAVPDFGSLLGLVDPRHPLAFVRGTDGIVGLGAAVRLTFTGSSRIADAADAWRTICESATVEDAVGLPGTGLIAIGSFAFAHDSATESVLIVPEVIYGRHGDITWRTSLVEERGEASRLETTPRKVWTPVTFTTGTMSRPAYADAVATTVERIHAGTLSKAVLARDQIGELALDTDLRAPLERLSETYPDAVTFAVEGLLGASPETLVKVEGGTVTARVLAGTAARGSDAAAVLLHSRKDLDEHGLARASVVAALRPHTSELDGDEPYVLELPNLLHIASDLHGTLGDGSSALDLVAAMHPTAAVGGTPTDVAVEVIAELEPFDRGRYAGPVGWIDASGSGEWALALRSAQVADGRVTAYAGAGIVAESVPVRELAETDLKFRPILDAFA